MRKTDTRGSDPFVDPYPTHKIDWSVEVGKPTKNWALKFVGTLLLVGVAAATAIILFVLPGCAVRMEAAPVPGPAVKPVSDCPGGQCVAPAVDRCTELGRWAAAKADSLSGRFGVPVPTIIILNEPAPWAERISIGPFCVVATYNAGTYTRPSKTVRVWLKDPHGADIPLDEAQQTFLHEWLHHFDYENGCLDGGGPDHNERFAERIREMGLAE